MRIDRIIENVRATTLAPDRPLVNRIGVHGGRIIGFDDDLDGVEASEHIDLGGRYAVPGFHDSHLHLAGLGSSLRSLDLRPEAVPTLEKLYAVIEEAAKRVESGEWVIGRGFNQMESGGYPQRQMLDKIAGDRPVFLSQFSGHVAVVNTAAFSAAGIPDPDTVADPDGGVIVRENGVATGLLKEKATDLFGYAMGGETEGELLENLKLASEHALSLGLTSITEPGIGQDRYGAGMGKSSADVHYYLRALNEGLLNLRGTLMPSYHLLHDLGETSLGNDKSWGMDAGIRSGFGNDWLKLGAFKVQIDGAFSGHSALLKQPYQGSEKEYGVRLWDPEILGERMIQLHRLGWQIAAHAIGDEGVDIVLSIMEEAQRRYPREDPRHRIEHCGLTDDGLLDRIVAAGVLPVPQGSFIGNFGDDYIAILGEQRAHHTWRMRSFVDKGVIISGSTDAPVTSASPLYTLQCMVTRKAASGVVLGGGKENLTVEQALHAYTFGSAYADHDERNKGTLEPGKLADLTVLGEDLLSCPEESIKDIPVLATLVGGEVKFAASSL